MEKKEKEPELVDFVVTARKYKTTLTEKYKNRKMWHKPFAGDVVSHLPGTVEKLCVSQGQEVQAGDLLLILEAMAQATGILAFKSVGKLEPGELYYFAGIDEARFKRPVVPGDQMIMEVTFEKTRRGLTRFKGVALVDGKVVCEATMMCARSREA